MQLSEIVNKDFHFKKIDLKIQALAASYGAQGLYNSGAYIIELKDIYIESINTYIHDIQNWLLNAMKANKLPEEELNKIIEDIKVKKKEILDENFQRFSQHEAVKKSAINSSALFQDDFKHAFNKAISLLEANCIELCAKVVYGECKLNSL